MNRQFFDIGKKIRLNQGDNALNVCCRGKEGSTQYPVKNLDFF